MSKPVVIVESPYAGDVEKNLRYARAAVRDCILRGEVPLASHLLYTQEGVLDDNKPEERQLGIELGLAVRHIAERTVVYEDLGVSEGMHYGIADAKANNRPVEYRSLKTTCCVACTPASAYCYADWTCSDPWCECHPWGVAS